MHGYARDDAWLTSFLTFCRHGSMTLIAKKSLAVHEFALSLTICSDGSAFPTRSGSVEYFNTLVKPSVKLCTVQTEGQGMW